MFQLIINDDVPLWLALSSYSYSSSHLDRYHYLWKDCLWSTGAWPARYSSILHGKCCRIRFYLWRMSGWSLPYRLQLDGWSCWWLCLSLLSIHHWIPSVTLRSPSGWGFNLLWGIWSRPVLIAVWLGLALWAVWATPCTAPDSCVYFWASGELLLLFFRPYQI